MYAYRLFRNGEPLRETTASMLIVTDGEGYAIQSLHVISLQANERAES